MKVLYVAMGGILLGSLLIGRAGAEGIAGPILDQPESIQQTAFEYDNYLYFAPEKGKSPSDVPPPAPAKKKKEKKEKSDAAPAAPVVPAAPAVVAAPTGGCCETCATGCDNGCNNGCGNGSAECGRNADCSLFGLGLLPCVTGDPWRLPRPCFMQENDIQYGGWVDSGISGSGRREAGSWNGVIPVNDRDGEYIMNQLYFFMKKDVKTDGCGVDLGGRVDFLYGTDARHAATLGMEQNWRQMELYQLALPQMFVDLGVNDWTIRAGHFYSTLGYEVLPAPDNFFYSKSYAFHYGNPYTFTGMLVTRKVNDQLSAYGGVHRGANAISWQDTSDDSMGFVGGVTWAGECKKLWTTLNVTSSREGAGNSTNIANFIVKITPNDDYMYVFESTIGQSVGGPVNHRDWTDINQYLIRKINDCWSAGVRAEWFRDNNGGVVTGFGVPGLDSNGLPTNFHPNPHVGPYVGDFYEVAAGLNYRPHPNLLIRPEVRYDWFNGTIDPASIGPYPGNRSDELSAAVDLIVTF